MDSKAFVKPPRRALFYWRIRALLLAFVPSFLVSFFFPLFSLWWYLITGAWLLAFFYFFCFWYPIKWKKLSYCLIGRILYLNNGIIYTHRRFIETKNIQYVEVYHDPIMKLFHISTVVIHAPGVVMYMPGLLREDALALCDALCLVCGAHFPGEREAKNG